MPSIHVSADSDILKLEELQVRFTTTQGEVTAVRDLSLSVAPGECLGVVGESGAGKSQAFLAALGLLAANGRVLGRALFAGENLLQLDGKALDRIRGARIGTVFQDPMTSLTPHIRIGEQLAEPLVRHAGVSWGAARARGLALLRDVHVTDPERRMGQFPHELSGGMRQRVVVAMALMCDPVLLIADEPTTALDVTIQAQILALLAEMKRRRGMALVLISHDFGAIAGLADRVAVMQSGQLVELDTVRNVLKAPRQLYTRALLQAVPTLEGPVPTPCADVTPRSDAPVLDGDASLLTVSGLSVRYAVRVGMGRRRPLYALDGVDFRLRRGEALGIVGESGSGKSTLARAILQLIPAAAGQVVWLGQPLSELASRELKSRRRDLQMVFQDPLASLDPRMTIGEIVEEPLRVHRRELDRTARSRAVDELLQRVGLSSQHVHRYPHELSGGQCQRVGIARAMILRPSLLVCDEPVSALDVSIQGQIIALLQQLKREYGLSILFVSHHLAVVRQLCERILVLYLGRMMELGGAQALCAMPLHPYTRALVDAVPVADPDVQPGRLTMDLRGEPASPLSPPAGCVYRTRCPHAIAICGDRVPDWDDAGVGRQVACHRWRDLGRG